MIGLLDTSVFIASESGRPLGGLPDEVAVSAVTLAGLQLGVLMAADVDARFRRMGTLSVAEALEPIPVDQAVAKEWAGLVARLREADRRMPMNDAWIAATALSRGMAVVTQDDDFTDIPGLEVIRV